MSESPIRPTTEQQERRFSTAQIRLAGFIVVLAVVNIAYRLVYTSGASQTAALYVGVPTLLAVGLALLPRSKSATGMILKGSTLAVLIACAVLPEGLLCLLFGLTGERSVDHHSHMHLTVVESTEGRLVFSIDHDTTMLARWVDLERAVVTWEPIDDHHTRVTWRLEYRRLLYPTLYFAPLQRFGMSEAADYLLDSIVVAQLP